MSISVFNINGLRIVNVHNSSDNVCLGFGVIAGANQETPDNAGVSHFGEHMFFKGTKKRTWHDISIEFAKLGVYDNAFTGYTDVFYYTAFPKESIDGAIPVIMDLFFNSTFPEEEIEKERKVILEEKKMYQDDPQSYFSSKSIEELLNWDKGHDILGEYDTIQKITRDDLISYMNEKYSGANIILFVCGDVSDENLKKMVSENLPDEHPFLRKGSRNSVVPELWSNKKSVLVPRDNIEQSNIYMFVRGLSGRDNCFQEGLLVQKAIGAMAGYSMLYQRIRHELGLCYSVGMTSFSVAYPDYIIMNLFGYTSPNNVDLFVEEVKKVLKEVIKNGISQEIFECAKADLFATLKRRTETSMGRAMFMVQDALFENYETVDQTANKIQSIKLDTCNELVAKLFDTEYRWAIMKPKKSEGEIKCLT